MSTVKVVRAHPVVTMFVLAYGFTWIVWIPRAAGVDLGWIARAWTWAPAMAALATAALLGKAAVRDWASRLVRWRVDWRWYAGVILGPAAFSLAVAGCYALLGGSWTAALPWISRPALLLPLLLIILTLSDGFGEEPAWRGFALPRMLQTHGTPGAGLVVGVFWALWHLPLLWTPGVQAAQLPWWLLLIDVPAKSVIFAWVFQRTGGSVLIAAILHGATNLFTVSPAVSTAHDLKLPILATAAKWILVGAGYVVYASRRSTSRPAVLAGAY